MAHKTDNKSEELMKFIYGEENYKKPMYRAVFATHHEEVRTCDHCGTSMSRSDVNDYGSLCEHCYMREYYG